MFPLLTHKDYCSAADRVGIWLRIPKVGALQDRVGLALFAVPRVLLLGCQVQEPSSCHGPCSREAFRFTGTLFCDGN